MTDIPPIDEAVAERQLTFVKDSGEEQAVLVRIGAPYEEQSECWRCPYEIVGPDRTKRFGMAGADSVQALLLTCQVISAELDAWAKRHKGAFHWHEGDPDTGFPSSEGGNTKY